jgi:hypothetical protein
VRYVLLMLLLLGDGGWLPPARPAPSQFVVVSFDGAGDAADVDRWVAVGARTNARFTFFLSGVYLLAGDRAQIYRPPQHHPGASDIGFAIAFPGEDVRVNIGRLVRSLNDADAAGHEVASHFNGHFCGRAAGAVGSWGPADWGHEIEAFRDLVTNVDAHNDLGGASVAFDARGGARTPCLEGVLAFERGALGAAGYRYDASEPADRAPYRADGIWEIPIQLMRVAGTADRTLATDYNLYLYQSQATDADPADLASLRAQALATYRSYFWTHYEGAREPVIFAHHFEDWNDGLYSSVLEQVLAEVCVLRDVRCVSYRTLVDELDARSAAENR